MHNKQTIKAIEDFLIVKSDRLKKAPLAFIFGGIDLKLSDAAFRFFNKGYCKYIFISGGKNKKLEDITEAQWHKDHLIEKGVPPPVILIEERASNTLENVQFSKPVIKKILGRLPDRLIVICKAFHGRRAIMTLRKHFSKNTDYILQVVATKNHETFSWWRRKKTRDHIIDEIRKIGEYTLKGDLGYK